MGAEFRYACRTISRMPVVAAVIVASLGVGIGVNAVVFSWIEAVIIHPLPAVRDSADLQLIEPRNDAGIYIGSSWLEYRDLRDRMSSIDGLFAFRMVPLYLGESGRVERGNGLLVSANYFDALRLRPAAGRFLRADEVSTPGGAPVAVISFAWWQTRFASAPDVVGRSLRVNARDVTVVGVAPRGFEGTTLALSFDLWLPATLAPVLFEGSRELEDRDARGYSVLGRLTPGATRAQAQSELEAQMRDLARTYPDTNASVGADLLPYSRMPRGPQRLLEVSLAVLQGLTLLLLLAMCGNTANLVLARASSRQREIAVRLALGGGRWRIVRLLLIENLMLGAAGALVGAAIGFWGTDAFRAFPAMRVRGIPIAFHTSFDAAGVAAAALLGIGCGLVFGAAPALQLAGLDPTFALRMGSNTPRRGSLRRALIAGEVAIAVVVLIVAASFFRSLLETRTMDPGFRRDGILLAAYDLTGRAASEASNRAFAAALLERLGALPSVEGAAIATSVPLDIHGLPTRQFAVQGHARTDAARDQALANTVTPGYFAVMGIPIKEGKDFADLNDKASVPEAIVNEEFVRRYLGGAQPLGRRIQSRDRAYVIVGVVANSLYNAFGDPPIPIVYYSYRDRPSTYGEVHLRTRPGAEAAVVPDLRRVVRALDPELPVFDVRTLNDHIDANLIFRRVPARIFSVAGPLLLLLASIGIYAVVSYTVSLRTTEIGVRVALGATTRRVVGALMGESLALVTVGVIAGWLLAFVVALDFLQAPVDVGVFAGVPSIALAVGSVACWLPARRAARVDPVVALRQDV
jgi:putative ABC transport system permease protein